MSTVITMSGEIKFNGDVGPRGLQGEKGDKGDKPIKGVDYFTADEKQEMVNEVTEDATNQYNQNVTAKTAEFDSHVTSEKRAATDEITETTQAKLAIYNANHEEKLNAYNTNASDKTGTFNSNASSKTTDFNNNYTEKVGTIDQKASDFNTNYTNKTNAFNQNASDKTDAFNSNATSKTGTFNDNASSKTDAFNSNASSKTGDFNDNATSKTNTFNQNASDKTDAFNANYTQKVADFNDNTSTYVQRLGAVEDDVEDHEARITDLELLKSNLNVETTTKSTYHNIIDSLNAKIEDFVMYGMTEQYTTTGKNKLKIEDSILTDNGLTATISNGKIKITGTTTENYIWIKITDGLDMRAGTPNTSNKPNWFNKSLLTGNTYTFSKIGTCGYTLNGLINGTSTTSMLIASNATENTVDLTETILSGIAIYIQDSGTRVNIEFLIQAVEGNTADYNYEQYTGRTTFAFSNISTKYWSSNWRCDSVFFIGTTNVGWRENDCR